MEENNKLKDDNTIKQSSEIQTFYKDSTIFLTGASGYLGKLLLEKLLWSCRDIRKIYILLRSKKDKDTNTRFMEIFNTPIFERLKLEPYNFIEKVSFLVGDCNLPNLGLSENDLVRLTQNVDCIFHCAAAVQFNCKLKDAVNINTRCTRDLLWIAREMKQLRAFIYISTAYSNCPHEEINEDIYPVPLSAHKVLTITDTLDDTLLEKITPTLLGDWPNTYSYTKALTEDMIKVEGKGLPIAIVRPSIVLATAKEPMAGWIDNVYGPTGTLLAIFLGVIHTVHSYTYKIADIVPGDYVVNTIISAAWDIALTKSTSKNGRKTENDNNVKTEEIADKDVPVYNYVSSTQKSINWAAFLKLSAKYSEQIPSPLLVWIRFVYATPNFYVHRLSVFILHFLPAYILDFIIIVIGKNPRFVKNCNKIDKLFEITSYFGTNEWKFSNTNTQALWKRLKTVDQDLFDFDMSNIDWEMYFYSYMRGCRIHILKDPLDTVPQGKVKQRNVRIAHYTIMVVVVFLLFSFVRFMSLSFISIYSAL